jgi:TonB family protein
MKLVHLAFLLGFVLRQDASSPVKPDVPATVAAVPLAQYSEAARQSKYFGTARVRVWIDERGKVTDAKVVSDPQQGFDVVAIKVARAYTFHPAKLGGKPVVSDTVVTISISKY